MIGRIKESIKGASENDIIIYKNVIGAFIVKGGAFFVTLYTLPVYINFFNNDEMLGMWFAILSLLNWILNFDLGIGNGLRNHLSISLSKNLKVDVKGYISSAYCSVGIIVFALSLLFPFAIYGVNLNTVFSISSEIVSPKTLYIVAIIVFVGVMLQFWLKLVNSILYALQKSFVNNFLVLCTNVIILLVAKFYPSRANEYNIIVMAITHALAVIIPLLIATWWVFRVKIPYAFPKFEYISRKYTKNVLSLGGVFFFVQIAYMLIMSTNEFLITKMSGNTYNVEYQAYYKLFSLGSTVFALALTPMWSVITKAKAEKNYNWIKKVYKKFMTLGFLFCFGEFAIILLIQPIMRIWLGDTGIINVDYSIGLVFAILGCFMIINSVLSSVANGIGELKTQAVCFGLGAILKVPLSLLLVTLLDSWIGVVISNVICMGIYCCVQPLILHNYMEKS